MAGEVMIPTLASALQAIGQAHVYYGDPFTANTWAPLGQKHGRIDVNHSETWNDLRAEDITGPMVHASYLMGQDLSATVPIIMAGDGSTVAKISPTGTAGLGFSSPQRPVETGIAIIPDIEVGGGLTYATATWTRLAGNGVGAASGASAAPKHAIWLWRCRIGFGALTFGGGADDLKLVTPVTIQAMFATNAGVTEGMKLGYIGDPTAATVPAVGFLFSAVP